LDHLQSQESKNVKRVVTLFALSAACAAGCGGSSAEPPADVKAVQEKIFDENQKFSLGNSGPESLVAHWQEITPAERAKEIRGYASAEASRRYYAGAFKKFVDDKDPDVATAAKEALENPAPDATPAEPAKK
jgi:hypothetical protein